MAETKRFYWLKLDRNFFKRHDIRIVEGMPNGKDYLLFYLKLMVEAVDHEGRLRFSDTIPYDVNMLAIITNTNVDIVRSAMELLQQLKMVEILDDQTIFLQETAKLLGSETDKAALMRRKRAADKEKEMAAGNNVTTMLPAVTNCYTEKEKEIEKDKEKEIYTRAGARTREDTDQRFEQFWGVYPRKVGKPKAKQAFYKAVKNEETFDAVMDGLRRYKNTERWTRAVTAGELDFIPHPTTWLNQRRWEDEIPEPAQKPPGVRESEHGMLERDYEEEELRALVHDPIADILAEMDQEAEA